MGVLNLVALALFAVGSFAGNNNQNPTEEDSLYEGKKWVVLVAGSKGWNNYKHQANTWHAYQLIKSDGIPEENIITMMVDDIAYNKRNPKSGKIINKPKGPDVYKGVIIDYKGADVNKSNFLKIITGDQEGMQSIGSRKVVKNGQHDTIFINFVDHGSTESLGFPDDYLYADELNDEFSSMYGTYIKSALSESSEQRSIFNDHREVRTNVTKSNIMIYGDFDIGREKLSSFMGYHENSYEVSRDMQQSNIKNTVSSRDVHERKIQYQLAHGKWSVPESHKLSAELRQNNKMRSVIDSVLKNICSEMVKARPDIKSEIGEYDEPNYLKLNLSVFPCYRSILNQITESCFSLPKNPYGIR